jgi:RIO kinase 1
VSFDFDSFDDDPLPTSDRWNPRSASRALAHKRRKPKKTAGQILAELAEAPHVAEDPLEFTYQPARHEAIWLRESLQPFFDQALVEDVLALVKGGKEANVYLCRATPPLGTPYLAAKVYRPRQFRNLRNDQLYREGRELLTSLGVPIKNRDTREMRAIRNKTSYGAELTHISWLMYEYLTLQRLYELGAAVPRPFSAADNALLMAFIGDVQQPAPVLHGQTLPPEKADQLFHAVLSNVELMLQHGLIHGDLSAYNILYWEQTITLIDFPQVTLSEGNHNAYALLHRDLQRVCEYFAQQGVHQNASALTAQLWKQYVRTAPNQTLSDGYGSA